jgi:hypothetical protein
VLAAAADDKLCRDVRGRAAECPFFFHHPSETFILFAPQMEENRKNRLKRN